MQKNISTKSNEFTAIAPTETIENLILNIRGKQVILDRDLARLYGVETKVLNQAVKRNPERFPEDFMFQLSNEETDYNLRSQIVTSSDNLYNEQRYTFFYRIFFLPSNLYYLCITKHTGAHRPKL